MKKVLVVALAVIMAVAVFAGCSTKKIEEAAAEVEAAAEEIAEKITDEAADAAEDDGSLAYIIEKGTLVMGLDDSFPPMGFRDENGEIAGFDVDLAKEVASRLGVELVLQPIDWKAKEMELNNKNIDVIWNGFTITDERKENLLMSSPYMKNEQIVVVPEGSEIKTLADLNGKKVAVQDGSSAQEALAADEELIASIEQIDFKDNVTAFMDLAAGQVDALAVDSVVANYYLAQEQNTGKFVILDETLAPEEYGIGFRKGDVSFEAAVEAALDEMRADGKFAEISTVWFGKDISAE